MSLEKAGSGSVRGEAFNAVVDELEGHGGRFVTAADIDSQAAQDGDVLTADGAGGASWEAGGGSQPEAWRWLDLGIVEFADLVNGPTTLYTPVAGEAVIITFDYGDFLPSNAELSFVTIVGQNPSYSPTVGEQFDFEITSGAITAESLRDQFSMDGHVATGPGTLSLSFLNAIRSSTDPIVLAWGISSDDIPRGVVPVCGIWQANHAYSVGDTIAADGSVYTVTDDGVSDNVEPTWLGTGNATNTVTDNTVTWTDQGDIATEGQLHFYAIVATPTAP